MKNLIEHLKAGFDHLKNQDYHSSAECAGKALSVSPTNKDALMLMGMSQFHQGNYEQSLKLFKEMRENQPYSLAVEVYFLKSLLHLNSLQKALDEINLQPKTADEILSIKIDILERLGEKNEIIQTAEKLSDEKEKLQHLAWNHEQLSDLSAAKHFAKELRSLDSGNFYANMVLAKVHLRKNNFKKAQKRLKQIHRLSLSLTNQSLYFALKAQIFEKQQKYKKAFEAYRKSNELLKHTDAYKQLDGQSFYTFERIQWIRDYFSQERSFQPLISSQKPVVFMVGYPRSGTTLLENILNAHGQIETIEERPTIDTLLNLFLGGNHLNSLEELSEKEIIGLQNSYLEARSQYIGSDAALVIDKLPLNLIHMGILYRIFPNAKFIISKRNVRDVALSCFFQSFKLNDAMSYFLDWEQTKKYLREIMSLGMDLLKALPIDYKIVNYEELVSDPFSQVREMIEFLNLPWDDEILNYRSKIKGRNVNTPSYAKITEKINKSQVQKHRNYKDFVDFS